MSAQVIYVPSEDGTGWEPRHYRTARPVPKRPHAMLKAVEREQKKAMGFSRAQAILPVPLLQKKLGASTFRLWCVLLTLRNEECETHPSLPGLAKRAGLGESQTRKCLARLRDFKLVEDYGFMYRHVPCRCDKSIGYHEHKVYVRSVYGLLSVSNDNTAYSALVPRATLQPVKEAAGQGGARVGAGRPKGKLDSAPRRIIKGGVRNSNVAPYKYQEPICYEEPTVLQTNAPFHGAHGFGSLVRVEAPSTTHPHQPMAQPAQPALVLPTPTQPVTAQAALGVINQTRAAQPPRGTTMPKTAEPPMVRVVDTLEEEAETAGQDCAWLAEVVTEGPLGLTLGGTGTALPPPQRYTSEDMRAATALSNEIEVARIPAPPRLREAHSEDERLALLRAAYSAAHERVLRKSYWKPKGKQMTPKERQAYLEACSALMAENISPTSWARFSFWAWAKMGKKEAPSSRWVWSAQRIHEHADWCHESTGEQITNSPIPGCPSTKELIHRLGKLRAALGYGRPTEVVLSEVLPPAERRRLMEQAAQEREAAKRDIEQRIRQGEWVWG